MGYPPPNARTPQELGAAPTAKVVYFDFSDSAGSGNDCGHHVLLRGGARALWDALVATAHDAQAAAAKAASEQGPQDVPPTAHLWKYLDPSLTQKTAPFKAAVQAHYVNSLIDTAGATSEELQDWLLRARDVGKSMHQLFLHGVKGWSSNIHTATQADAEGLRTEWWPFEDYDPTAVDARYAGCFGEHCVRTRTRIRFSDDQELCQQWKHAAECTRAMLDMESLAGTGLALDPFVNLEPAQIGGLFLLTHVADNYAKRTELFNSDFWMLRAIHFGMERATNLRLQSFSLSKITQQQQQHVSNPARAYCRVEAALHTLVAMKVVVFLKMRLYAFDRLQGKELTPDAALQKLVRVDRHDIEQCKRGFRTLSSDVSAPHARPEQPSAKKQRRLPVVKNAEEVLDVLVAKVQAMQDPLSKRYRNVSEVLKEAEDAQQVYLQRLLALERVVCAYEAKERAVLQHMDQLRKTEILKLSQMSYNQVAPYLSKFKMNHVREHAVKLVKTQALKKQTLQLSIATDGVLATIGKKVVEDQPTTGVDVPDEKEWVRLFGPTTALGNGGLYGTEARGARENGLAWQEAVSVAERYLEVHEFCRGQRQRLFAHNTSAHQVALPPFAIAKECLLPEEVVANPEFVNTKLDTSVEAYRKLVRANEKTKHRHDAFVAEAEGAFAHAMRTCLLRAAELAQDNKEKGDSSLPASRSARIAQDILEQFAKVAKAESIFSENVDEAFVTLQDTSTLARKNWAAAKRLLTISIAAEPFLRDPRRNTGMIAWQERNEREKADANYWWPIWPPLLEDLRLQTRATLQWGRILGREVLGLNDLAVSLDPPYFSVGVRAEAREVLIVKN